MIVRSVMLIVTLFLVGSTASQSEPDWSLVNELLENVSVSLDGKVGPLIIPFDGNVIPGVKAEVTANLTALGPFSLSHLSVGDIELISTAFGTNAVQTQVKLRKVQATLRANEVYLDVDGRILIIGLPTPLNILGNGSITVELGLGIDLGLRWEANTSLATTPPQKVVVENCDAGSTWLNVQCTGNWPNLTILGTTYPICSLVAGLIDPGTLICDELVKPNTLSGVNKVLASISQLVVDAESKPLPTPPPAAETEAFLDGEEGLTTLTNATLVEGIKLLLDSVYAVPGTPPLNDSLVATQVLEAAFPGGLKVANLTLLKFLGFEVEIHSLLLQAGGVDVFDLLQMSGNFTSSHDLTLKWLSADLALDIVVPLHGRQVRNRFSLDFNATNTSLHARILTALRPALLGPLPLGGFVGSGIGSFLDCLLIPTVGLKLTDLSLALKQVVKADFKATLIEPPLGETGGFNTLVEDIIKTFGLAYGPSFDLGIPIITQTYVGPLLSGLLNKTAEHADSGKCTASAAEAGKDDSLVDFNHNFVVTLVDFLVNTLFGSDPDSDIGINTAVTKMTEALGFPAGHIVLNGTVGGVVLDKPIPGKPADLDLGTVSAWGGNVTIELAPMSRITVLEPLAECNGTDVDECHTLNTNLSFRSDFPVWLSADARIKIGGSPTGHLDDWFRITLGFDALSVLFDLKAFIEAPALQHLTVQQVTAPGCLLSTFASNGLEIPQVAGSLDSFRLKVDCESDFHSCTGYVLPAWSAGLNGPNGIKSLTNLANKVMTSLGTSLESPGMQNLLHNWVDTASCTTPANGTVPPPPPYHWKHYDNSGFVPVFVYMILPNILVFIVLISITIRGYLKTSRMETTPLLHRDSPGPEHPPRATFGSLGGGSPPAYEADEDDHWFVKYGVHESLFWHPSVSPVAQWGVPIIILAATAVMLSSQLHGYMISIRLPVVVAGDKLDVKIFDYTTIRVVQTIWGDTSMLWVSMLVGILGGALPYIKFQILFWAWFCPTKMMTLENRSSLLKWMDYLCKWSLLDVLLSSTLVVVVFTSIYFPDSWEETGLWVPGLFTGSTECLVGWGCWGLLIAQGMNLIVGHYMVVSQRGLMTAIRVSDQIDAGSIAYRSEDGKRRSLRDVASVSMKSTVVSMASTCWFQHGAEYTVKEPLRGHVFKRGMISKVLRPFFTFTGRKRVKVNLAGRLAVFFGILTVAGLLIGGLASKMMGTKYEGIITLAMHEMTDDPSSRNWTFFQLVHDYVNLAHPAGAIQVMGVLWVTCCFVIPLVACWTLLALWVVPLTLVWHKRALVVCECLVSWSAIDVFVVVGFMINVKADVLMNFTLGTKVTYLNAVVASARENGIYPEGSPLFLLLKGWMQPGWYLCLAMALLSNTIYILLHRAAEKAIADREWAIDHPRRSKSRVSGEARADYETDSDEEEGSAKSFRGDTRSPSPTHEQYHQTGVIPHADPEP
eukprot:Hpha_TRINITY_DN15659_c3_g3::TRINITY_DN15659_c3_g3_i1::g.101343::m.101343